MKSMRSWVGMALCASWLLAAAYAAAAPYVVLGPGLSTRPMVSLEPAVRQVEARIAAWDKAFAAAGIPVRRLFSGPYGSGFLRLNRKGMDLDYACVLDLGPFEPVHPEAMARAIRERIKAALEVVRDTNRRLLDTPALFVYARAGFDRMLRRVSAPRTLDVLARRLAQIQAKAGSQMFFEDRQGRRVAAQLLPFQVVLPVNVKLHAASHAVHYYPGMFRGLREVSVQFFFTAAIQTDEGPRFLNVCPLYEKGGRPIPFYDMMLTNVFLSREEAGRYLRRVRHLNAEEVLRLNGPRLYRISQKEYRRGRFLKQLKRMHQYFNVSGGMWQPARRQAIEAGIRRWLWSPWSLIASDLPEQGKMWLETDAAMRAVFIRAGALKELGSFVQYATELFAPYDANMLAGLRALAERFSRGEAVVQDFQRLEKLGARLAHDTAPTAEEMRYLLSLN